MGNPFRVQLVYKDNNFICLAPAESPKKPGYNVIEVISFDSYLRLKSAFGETLERLREAEVEIEYLKEKLSEVGDSEFNQSMG